MIFTSTQFSNAVISKNENSLEDIRSNSKNIVVYKRSIEFLKKELDQIASQSMECHASGTVEEIIAKLIIKNKQLISIPNLVKDIFNSLRLFENVIKANSYRLLVSTVSDNMCRRFHTDVNDLRLLCTYIGPGTLWLPNEAVNFEAYQGWKGNQKIVKNEKLIQQVNTGDVVLLKGSLYGGINPILHRSPSIEENGVKRLLLRIDTDSMT